LIRRQPALPAARGLDQDLGFGVWPRDRNCRLGLDLGLEVYGLGLGVDLALYSWSWQSVAVLGVVSPVLVLNLKFHRCKLIHITIARYSKLSG